MEVEVKKASKGRSMESEKYPVGEQVEQPCFQPEEATTEFATEKIPSGKFRGVMVQGLDDSSLLLLLDAYQTSGEHANFCKHLIRYLNERGVQCDEHSRDEPVTVKNLEWLLKQQGYRCALSGIELTPESVGLDHIDAKANGGTHTLGNVQLVDKRINIMKARLEQSEFIELCAAVTKAARDNIPQAASRMTDEPKGVGSSLETKNLS